jgi:protein-tyrosine phosphatase
MDPEFIKKYKIKRIINVTPDIPNTFSNIKYLHLPIIDNEAKINNLSNIYHIASDFINEGLVNNEGILVHCKRGHHRSANIICAFMYKYLQSDYVGTIKYINFLRNCALRRDTQMGRGLHIFYMEINNIDSSNMNKNEQDCGIHKTAQQTIFYCN